MTRNDLDEVVARAGERPRLMRRRSFDNQQYVSTKLLIAGRF